LKKISELRFFLLKLSGFYFFWLISSHYLSYNFSLYGKMWLFLYHLFLKVVSFITVSLLSILNYDFVSSYRQIAIIGTPGILIVNPCVGFGLTYMFWALIISYPGKKLSKFMVILLGTIILQIANGIRMFVLVTGMKFNLDINPVEVHDLFNNIIYIIIFIIWFVWINYFNNTNEKKLDQVV